jgi:hypothetical protein
VVVSHLVGVLARASATRVRSRQDRPVHPGMPTLPPRAHRARRRFAAGGVTCQQPPSVPARCRVAPGWCVLAAGAASTPSSSTTRAARRRRAATSRLPGGSSAQRSWLSTRGAATNSAATRRTRGAVPPVSARRRRMSTISCESLARRTRASSTLGQCSRSVIDATRARRGPRRSQTNRQTAPGDASATIVNRTELGTGGWRNRWARRLPNRLAVPLVHPRNWQQGIPLNDV